MLPGTGHKAASSAQPATVSRHLVGASECRYTEEMRATLGVTLITSLFLALAGSCSHSGSQLKASWIKPGHKPARYGLIAAVAITDDSRNREVAENSAVAQLTKHGLKARSTYKVFSAEPDKRSKEELIDVFQKLGVDAVLTMRVLGMDTEVKQRDNVDANYGVYRDFNDYYPDSYYNLPDADEVKQVYKLEANLYEVDTGTLLWSAHSDIVNPKSLYEVIDDYTGQLVRRLLSDKVVTTE